MQKPTSLAGDTRFDLKSYLQKARLKTLKNVKALVEESVLFFEQARYPRATFCAMTAIEECGKIWPMYLITMDMVFDGKKRSIKDIDGKALRRILSNHTEKSRLMAISTLYINAGADRRHGQHPNSKCVTTSGIVLLARSREWMKWRNSCLYVDFNVSCNKVSSPVEVIDRNVAYYFICMAYEGIAESGEAGYGITLEGKKSTRGTAFYLATLKKLKQFMKKHKNTVHLSDLEFLSNPEKYRALAKEIEEKEEKR